MAVSSSSSVRNPPAASEGENPNSGTAPIGPDERFDRNSHSSGLDWSSKQSRILTANGLAPSYYSADRGFPFRDDELPHHHLGRGTSHSTFRRWSSSDASLNTTTGGGKNRRRQASASSLLVGAWTRPLFAGAWEHSTSADEEVYNLQSNTLFVDVRIPRSRPSERFRRAGSVSALTDEELRYYVRQHAFGGYAAVGREARPGRRRCRPSSSMASGRGGGNVVNSIRGKCDSAGELVCARHHVVDWNYLSSKPRNRPNKWWAEFPPPSSSSNDPKSVWKELSYATDDFGQHYYYERWERLNGDGSSEGGPVVAMRKCEEDATRNGGRDGIVVAIGDHFNYLFGRPNKPDTDFESRYPAAKSVVDLIELALEAGDRPAAEHYLSVDAGHGRISSESGWAIELSVQPWREGTALFSGGSAPPVLEQTSAAKGGGGAANPASCCVLWDGERWDVLECSGINDAAGLQAFFEVLTVNGIGTTRMRTESRL